MKAQEAIITYLRNLFVSMPCRWGGHILAVLVLNVLITYFFQPTNQWLAIILAALLWQITWEDWTTRQVDLRSVFCVFLTGTLLQMPNIGWVCAITFMVLGICFFIYEIVAIKIPPDDGGKGEVHYHSSDEHINEDNAPPFIPALILGVASLLVYYLMSWHLFSASTEFMLFSRMPFPLEWSPFLCIIPLFLIAAFLAKINNYKYQKRGYTIAYRMFGEGDIYILAVLSGVFGFTLTCWAFLIAIPISFIQSQYIKRKGIYNEH